MGNKSFVRVLATMAITGMLFGGVVAVVTDFGSAYVGQPAPDETSSPAVDAGQLQGEPQSQPTQTATGTQTAGQADTGGRAGGLGRPGGILGTIAKVSTSAMTLTTAQNEITVALSPETRVQKVGQNADGTQGRTGTLEDLKVGVQVAVVGQAGADGIVVARIVAITPAGFTGQTFRERFRGPGASSTPGTGGGPSGGPRPTQ